MESRLRLDILPQPDDTTCGPTCLHAVYRYYGDDIPLEKVVADIPMLEGGGTLAVFLACHALKRGYKAKIITYNLQVFDPTWFQPGGPDIRERLRRQAEFKDHPKLQVATQAYLEFLDLGGRLGFEDMRPSLIRRYLNRGHPLLTGLSATWLYRCAREFGPQDDYDDLRGFPSGHFVVLCGYDRTHRRVLVADPMRGNPVSESQQYEVGIERLICSLLLGILTYDANLLIIEPAKAKQQG